MTTYLTITGFGAHGNSGDESFKDDLFRSKVFQTERKGFEVSSGRHLGPGCREFESRHSDHKSRKSICSLGFYLLLVRLEQLNAVRMSAAGEGLTETSLYLRLTVHIEARHLRRTRQFSVRKLAGFPFAYRTQQYQNLLEVLPPTHGSILPLVEHRNIFTQIPGY